MSDFAKGELRYIIKTCVGDFRAPLLLGRSMEDLASFALAQVEAREEAEAKVAACACYHEDRHTSDRCWPQRIEELEAALEQLTLDLRAGQADYSDALRQLERETRRARRLGKKAAERGKALQRERAARDEDVEALRGMLFGESGGEPTRFMFDEYNFDGDLLPCWDRAHARLAAHKADRDE